MIYTSLTALVPSVDGGAQKASGCFQSENYTWYVTLLTFSTRNYDPSLKLVNAINASMQSSYITKDEKPNRKRTKRNQE